jgi:4-hydroxy-tetrahydrodipicolinate synthase
MSNTAPDRIAELLQAAGSRLWVYAGVDNVAFEGLCHGAHGWISGIPGMVPRVARRLYETIAEHSDLPAARAQWAQLAPIMRLQFGGLFSGGQDPHWLSVMKGTLNMVGPYIGDPLPPIRPLDEPTRQRLAGLLRAIGYDVAT